MLPRRVGVPSFFLLCSIPLCKCTTVFWSTHLLMDSGCFQNSATVSSAAMNIGVHRFFWIGVSGFLGYNPSKNNFSELVKIVKLLVQKAVPILVFWGNSILFSIVVAPVCNPTNSALGFPSLHNLSNTCCLLLCLWWPFWQVWGGISLWL